MRKYQNFAGYLIAVMSVIAALISFLSGYDPFGKNEGFERAISFGIFYLIAAGCGVHIARCAAKQLEASRLPRGIVLFAAWAIAMFVYRISEENVSGVAIFFGVVYVGHALVLMFPSKA